MDNLPKLPVSLEKLPRYIAENRDKPVNEILQPYREYESQLRSVFAQDRQSPALNDPYINVLPLFTGDTSLITTRARDLDAETDQEKSKYIMSLPDDQRRASGTPATVDSISEFQKNFGVFSESSLSELDWSNVVAAGSSVVNCLLPVPDEFNVNKRKLRQYYHEKFCPASDVDLFLYGLTHEQAIEKIKSIEQAIRDSILSEVTVVRTKYAITIASQYPVRHVQIVLRVYKSVSEILTGFDIDAAGGAYDGKQVYVTPRALGSFITQINHIDLSRRSPSYENRLSKYSHRNFEVYWPDLDRTRIDPTIFERSFQRTLGLARLLVLERLPTSSVREKYQNKRRQERGRPELYRQSFRLFGNIKGNHEDEVADWLSEEDVSNYHTFTVPYGEKFHAKRIEKLCYTRDLLLNAEWNQSKERKVYLHRHPAFFGRVQDVIEDCCGCCPEPVTPEEIEVAGKEAEIYISGKVSFLIDDPGRQQIGSFNPLTEQDWTDMAYVGNTARLCQSIVDGDVDDVLNWLSQEGADPNKRDYTGRSPLHLAVMDSTVDVVKCLVDHGARLTGRLADGKTALHLAASRGNAEIVKILMDRSITNEEEEIERQERRRKSGETKELAKADDSAHRASEATVKSVTNDDSDESDGELVDETVTETDCVSVATGSFVKVKKDVKEDEELVPEECDDEPDYYDIDVRAWDIPCSPLHLAIAGGHESVVELLCDYGADSILPVKILHHENDAILTLVLALSLPLEKAKSMAQLLLRLGAMCSQADGSGYTVFHKYVKSSALQMVDLLVECDKAGVKAAINHLVVSGNYWHTHSLAPLETAIKMGDPIMVMKLLDNGAKAEIDFDTWLKAAQTSLVHRNSSKDYESSKKSYKASVEQPLLSAIRAAETEVVMRLIDEGCNVNILTGQAERALQQSYTRYDTQCQSVLDVVREITKNLRNSEDSSPDKKPTLAEGMDDFLAKVPPGTYRHWMVSDDIKYRGARFQQDLKHYEATVAADRNQKGKLEKKEAIEAAIEDLQNIEKVLVKNGAKTFKELHPDVKVTKNDSRYNRYYYSASDSKPTGPYKHEARFTGDSSLNERRINKYIELMEAAWVGDINKIKSLTLQAWGEDQDQAPLIASINDKDNNSPFSLAFLRGHIEVAKAILEIVDAQWSPEEKDEVRYKMQGDDDEDNYSESCNSDDEYEDSEAEVRVIAEKVDKKFTIENVGQVSMQVKCHTKPMAVLRSTPRTFVVEKDGSIRKLEDVKNLLAHTIDVDDMNGLKELIDLAQHYAHSEKPDSDDEHARSFTFPANEFVRAVEHGKIQAVRYIIKRAGAGMPLDHLVKKSGVKMDKKPRYYQGLTVYGKKRKDWATAGRNMVVRSSGVRTPPLLHAVIGSRVDSVEFFLSDTPHRLYNEFAKTKQAREDPRLQHIMASPGGFNRAISKWLGGDNEMAMHCAVAAMPGPNANEVLEYLIETCPACLEKKTPGGETPLMVACKLGRVEFVKILIEAGADQTTRNLKGENIVHATLKDATEVCRLRTLLRLLDSDLRKHLFLQRKNLGEDGTTPLHAWIMANTNASRGLKPRPSVAILKLILEHSEGEELEMLNSAGDTCLHTVIHYNSIHLVKSLLDFNPRLLYRENAVGRTPAELAHDKLTAQVFSATRGQGISADFRGDVTLLRRRPELKFFMSGPSDKKLLESKAEEMQALAGLSDTYDAGELANILSVMGLDNPMGRWGSVDANRMVHVIWDLCRTTMGKTTGKRRLVSLNEANDVARRLGESHQASRYFSVNGRRDDDDDDDDDEAKSDGEGEENKGTDATDFATSRIGAARRWVLPEREDGTKMDIRKCAECGERHNEYE